MCVYSKVSSGVVKFLIIQCTDIEVYVNVRTTKTDGMPNITYVRRQLKPLGTDFKNIVDGFNTIWCGKRYTRVKIE